MIDHVPDELSGADFSAVANGALRRALERLCDEVDRAVVSLQDNMEGDWEED